MTLPLDVLAVNKQLVKYDKNYVIEKVSFWNAIVLLFFTNVMYGRHKVKVL